MQQSKAAARSTRSVEVFYAYSHKDELLRDELDTHLSILKRRGLVSCWHDRRISPGKEWVGEIDDRLNRADIILLLVSPDFISSDYCYNKEMTRAMERHEQREARVIPVVLRDCDWDFLPFSKLQGLPRDGKPVKAWLSQDEAFKDIEMGIRKVAEELRSADAAIQQASGLSSSQGRIEPPKSRSCRSPKPDPRGLLLYGPRLEVEVGPPILHSSAGILLPGSGHSRGGFSRMPALIDTGAGRTVVTPEVVARIGLPKVGMTRIARAGGIIEDVGEYAAAIQFPRYKLVSVELAKVICCELPEQPIQCLLGRDVLSRWRFAFDGRVGEWEIIEGVDVARWLDP